MNHYDIIIEVNFQEPREMPALPDSGESWRSAGYLQQFYCTEESVEQAKALVLQHFRKNEPQPESSELHFFRVDPLQRLEKFEHFAHHADPAFTQEMFEQRHQYGIWFHGEQAHFSSEEELAASLPELDDDDEDDDLWDSGYEGKCQACDNYGPVDDLSLCPACGEKLERDFIRQREWEYSGLAFGLPHVAREKLRDMVIEDFGSKLEILAPKQPTADTGSKRQSGKRKK